MTREEAMRNIEEVAIFLDNRGMSGVASSLIEAAKALMVTREPDPKTGLSSCQCAERLHNRLGGILGYTLEKTEEPSSLAYIEKIIAESDLIEVTLPNGTTLRATKFGENETV